MPEAWGFLCPVHTPDGSPCGLLNHFSAMCRLVTKRPESLEDTEVAINMVRLPGNHFAVVVTQRSLGHPDVLCVLVHVTFSCHYC